MDNANWHKVCLLYILKFIIKEIKIEYEEEKVNDAGGLQREWIYLVVKELFKPLIGLFVKADTPQITYKINGNCEMNENSLNLFRLLGKIIGKAIFERISLNCYLD